MAKRVPWLTAKYLAECFAYDPVSGDITWRTRPAHHFRTAQGQATFTTKHAGKKCSCLDRSGYLYLRVNSVDGNTAHLRGHRVAWALAHGLRIDDVPEQLDHKNLVRTDNSIQNLRPATQSQNQFNTPLKSHNTSGYKGVCFDKQSGKWKARITINGIVKTIGLFPTVGEAAEARAANQNLHGEFGRTA